MFHDIEISGGIPDPCKDLTSKDRYRGIFPLETRKGIKSKIDFRAGWLLLGSNFPFFLMNI